MSSSGGGGTILENLSNRKLAVVLAIILTVQLISFIIGAFFAPAPSSTEQVLATKCHPLDPSGLVIPRFTFKPKITSKNCIPVKDNYASDLASDVGGRPTVFAFQLPLPREGIELDFSRWMSNLLTVIVPEVSYSDFMIQKDGSKSKGDQDHHLDQDSQFEYLNGTLLLKVTLAVKDGPDGEWIKYASKDRLRRKLSCSIPKSKKINEYRFDCNVIQLFDLQSLHHDFYLINLEFVDGGFILDNKTSLSSSSPSSSSTQNAVLRDVNLVAIHQNGGFTKIWISLKSFFFLVSVCTLAWFTHRLRQLERSFNLMERSLILLGIALIQLNFPLEALSLWIDVPFNSFLSDLRQGILHVTLFCFWIIFSGEHLLPEQQKLSCRPSTSSKRSSSGSSSSSFKRGVLSSYYSQLSVVLIASISLLLFDSLERGIQAFEPFFSIWEVDEQQLLATGFLVIAAAASITFFAFLTRNIFLVLRNISSRQSSLPSMSLTRRLMYQGLIYRFKFLLVSTLICAAGTLAAFLVGQWSEDPLVQWSLWSSQVESDAMDVHIEWTSAMYTSVLSMWNCYIWILLILFAPSHKFSSSSSNDDLDDALSEQVEFSRLNPGSSYNKSSNSMTTTTSFATISSGETPSSMRLLQDLASKQAFD